MDELYLKKCVPCEGKTKPFSDAKVAEFLPQVQGWHVVTEDGIKRIRKNLHFVDFKRALSFVNEVGDIAEFEGHHPDLNIHQWNKLAISLSTHAIKGLSENDFIMAAKIDRALEETLE